jgi:hypothetical protein
MGTSDFNNINCPCCGGLLQVQLVAKKKATSIAKAKNKVRVKLTENFYLDEFHSKDGTPVPEEFVKNFKDVATQLEIIRNHFGSRPITIHSGYRTAQHNRAVGGVPNSYHKIGMAADFSILNTPAKEVQKEVKKLIQKGVIVAGGLGSYNSFTHYDIRGHFKAW